jgi:hypothetical protein
MALRSLPSAAVVPVTVDVVVHNDAPTMAQALANQQATPGTVVGFTVAATTLNDVDVGDTALHGDPR